MTAWYTVPSCSRPGPAALRTLAGPLSLLLFGAVRRIGGRRPGAKSVVVGTAKTACFLGILRVPRIRGGGVWGIKRRVRGGLLGIPLVHRGVCPFPNSGNTGAVHRLAEPAAGPPGVNGFQVPPLFFSQVNDLVAVHLLQGATDRRRRQPQPPGDVSGGECLPGIDQ